MSLMVSLGSERLMGSVGVRLELGWGTENISLKTGDALDRRLLRTRNRIPSDETMSTSGSLGLDIGLGAKGDGGEEEERDKESSLSAK